MHYKLTTLEDVFSSINQDIPLAFDTETAGKYGKICLAQFYQRGWDAVLMVQNPEPITLMAYLAKVDSTLVMQKANFDITTIQRQTGSRFIPKSFDCTLLLARLHFPLIQNYSLDFLLQVVLRRDPYKEHGIDKKTMQKAKWNVPTIPDQQLKYAAIDVWHLLDLYETVLPAKESISYKIDMISLREALDWQNNGLVVQERRWEEVYAHNNAKIAEYNVPINVNSYQQVRPYIGSEQSDGLGLATLALKGNERAAAVKAVRSLRKLNSFLDKYDKPIVYGCFGPYARSGRYTCDEDNLQQIPRALKQIFGPHRYMLYSDFSQLELRMITSITADIRMCQIYREGGDIHSIVSEMIQISRQISKTVNFNALYGGGASMLSSILIKDADILLPEIEVAGILRKWKHMFHGIKAWQERGIRAYKGGRPGSTPLGREYIGNMMTDQLNIENQGGGAEVAKLAKHYMYDDLKANDCAIMDFIHDSYLIDAPQDKEVVERVAPRIAEAMQEAWFEVTQHCKVKDIPMPVKVFGGYNWGDIEEGSYDYLYEAA